MNKTIKKEAKKFLEAEGIKISRKEYKHYFSHWANLSCFKYLPENFIRKYRKKLNWAVISYHQKNMSDKFIYEYRNKLSLAILIDRGFITRERLNHIEFLNRKEVPRFELMEIE